MPDEEQEGYTLIILWVRKILIDTSNWSQP